MSDFLLMGREGEGGGGKEGGGEGGREGVETVVSKFILHHRRSTFCKRRIPSRLKEIRPSQSHALLRIRRKRRVRSSISRVVLTKNSGMNVEVPRLSDRRGSVPH